MSDQQKSSAAADRKKMIEEQKEALAAEQAKEEQQKAQEAKDKAKEDQKRLDEEAEKQKKIKQSKAALKLQQAIDLKYQNLQSYADDTTKYQTRFVCMFVSLSLIYPISFHHSNVRNESYLYTNLCRLTDEQQREYWLAAQKNKMDKMPSKNFASYIKFQASQVPSNEIHGNFIYILFVLSTCSRFCDNMSFLQYFSDD